MSQPDQRFVALQHRNFRLLWFGRLVSTIGSQMQLIAINWHIFELLAGATFDIELFGRSFALDGQALGLGTLGLVRILPVLLFALVGGIMADTRDRRRLLLLTQTLIAIFSLLLALLTFTGAITIGRLYILTALAAAVTAFDTPARQAIVPHTVPREHLANALSLNTLLWYTGTIVGPGIAGWLISQVSVGWVYLIDAVTFGAVIVSLFMLRLQPVAAEVVDFSRASIMEGIRFTYNRKIIWSTMLLDFWATFFGSARTMLPLIADRIFDAGATGYGILATAQPVGAVIAALVLAYRSEIRRQGAVLLVSVAVYGLATALFGVSTWFLLSYFLFALTGVGDTVSTVIRGTIRQLATPDHIRGRMTSVNMMFFMGGPQLGEVEAGLVAAAFGVPAAIFSGGVAVVIITAYVTWRYSALRTYDREFELPNNNPV